MWGLVYASASRNIVDPSEIPMAVYCWGSFAAPGTMGFIIAGIVATLSLCTMTILVCVSMVALVRVRVYLSLTNTVHGLFIFALTFDTVLFVYHSHASSLYIELNGGWINLIVNANREKRAIERKVLK